MDLYIGNLPRDATAADLAALFTPFGRVIRAQVKRDRDTRQPRGTGLVQLTGDGAQAIAATHGTAFRGYTLTVRAARFRPGPGADAVVPPPPGSTPS